MTSAAEGSRLDIELVRRGLARSRGHASDLIDERMVRLDGIAATKASAKVTASATIEVVGGDARWVGRAAAKLVHALERWPDIVVTGSRCLDIGASTGGFTQVLLSRGAAAVTALDVGHGQLAPSVREDPRVTERSGTSVRGVGPDELGGVFAVVVADLSFISLTLVCDRVAALLGLGGHAVLLVKPQFEVGRGGLGKNGIVTSASRRAAAVAGVCAAVGRAELSVHGLERSPLPGGGGNVEYLLWVRWQTSGKMGERDIATAIEQLTREGPP